MSEPIYHGNRLIGYIRGDEFVKELDGRVHMLRVPKAWATDANAWDRIKGRIKRIRIKDVAGGREYVLTVWEFDLYKRTLERGHNYQYFVTLKKWRGPNDPEPARPGPPTAPGPPPGPGPGARDFRTVQGRLL